MSGSTSVLTPIGWALLHFVWQGVLVALALAAVLWLVPARAARIRYALACLALAAMAMMPIVTLTWLAADPASGFWMEHAGVAPDVGATVSGGLAVDRQGRIIAFHRRESRGPRSGANAAVAVRAVGVWCRLLRGAPRRRLVSDAASAAP